MTAINKNVEKVMSNFYVYYQIVITKTALKKREKEDNYMVNKIQLTSGHPIVCSIVPGLCNSGSISHISLKPIP